MGEGGEECDENIVQKNVKNLVQKLGIFCLRSRLCDIVARKKCDLLVEILVNRIVVAGCCSVCVGSCRSREGRGRNGGAIVEENSGPHPDPEVEAAEDCPDAEQEPQRPPLQRIQPFPGAGIPARKIQAVPEAGQGAVLGSAGSGVPSHVGIFRGGELEESLYPSRRTPGHMLEVGLDFGAESSPEKHSLLCSLFDSRVSTHRPILLHVDTTLYEL